MPMVRAAAVAVAAAAVACAPAVRPPEPGLAPVAAAPVPSAPQPAAPDAAPKPRDPIAPPDVAYRLGLMPLVGTGAAAWHAAHASWDGRGTVIAILDSGIDPSVPGLQVTSAGQAKILDLRNFSGEGDVALSRVRPGRDGAIALPGGMTLRGAGAVSDVATDSQWYGGVIRELPFGDAPAADFNGNGSNRDSYGVVVVRAAAGWLAFIDTNGDGTLADETPIGDFLVRGQTFAFRATSGASGPIVGAVNLFVDASGRPRLSLVLDTSGHGTHVAGIAAGHDLYGVPGFDGVAPGAQVLGLKIADDAHGGLSTTGSMLRAMEYATRFAAERGLPLVLNMSFGVGNEQPGAATMDSIVDDYLLAHPGVVFAISAGNDGPGATTMGLPASAAFALCVGSTYPAPFGPPQFGAETPDVLGWWSSRGGDLDKPDVVTPGMAYSTVPRWNTGEEIKLGTSMASPHAAGLAALLLSAARAERRPVTGAQVVQALRATAAPLDGETALDQGYGVPQVGAAYAWLSAGHQAPRFRVSAPSPLRPGHVSGNGTLPMAAVVHPASRPSVANRRWGLVSEDDTIQRFRVERVGEPRQSGASYRLAADAPWLAPLQAEAVLDAAGVAEVDVRYDRAQLAKPGRYVGVVSAYARMDSAAGPAFRLVSEIIVPDTGQWRTVRFASRRLGPDRAFRYFVKVPVGAAALSVRVAMPDTAERGYLYLFEPSGRPSRTKERSDLGGGGGKSGVLPVTANDIRPGIWEAVVQSVPGRELHYAFGASVPRISLARIDSMGPRPSVSFFSPAATDSTLMTSVEQVGVATGWQAAVERGAPYRRSFTAPAWATKAVVEVQLTP